MQKYKKEISEEEAVEPVEYRISKSVRKRNADGYNEERTTGRNPY
ncbi:hypothetical protein [Eubacterium ramulus]